MLSFATLVLSAAGAYAADADKASNEISFLVALLALVLVGRLLGEAMNCIGQPSVMGQLFAGILLGPSALGVVLPDLQQWLFAASKEQASMLDAISQFGILLLLLLTGMETDLGAEIGGLTKREALAVGCAMNARGSTEVIVATIGLSMGALSQNLYTMIVAMAVVTTMAMPPMLRWALSRVPLRKAEKQRLEREAMEAKEFVPNLERLLSGRR